MNNGNTYTHERLQREKQQLQKEILRSKKAISRHWNNLTATPPETSKLQGWVNQAEKAFVVYDGVMTGYKLLRRFNRFTSIFHKKRK